MNIGELFMLSVRWIHGMSAVIWVGGNIFYILVIKPYQNDGQNGLSITKSGSEHFKSLVNTCILVSIVTGTIMLFDRLTTPSVTSTYVLVLSSKIVLALIMFWIARRRVRGAKSNVAKLDTPQMYLGVDIANINKHLSGLNLTVIIGLLIFLISDLLQFLFLKGLTGG